MTASNDPADPAPASPGGPMAAQFGPHRFYAGDGGGSEQFRGARFDAADLRGARFTDCDLTGVTIRDGWLVNVSISGYLSNVTVNGVDVTDFVSAELDRRHPERVQFREGQTADDVHAMWDTIERPWAQATERAGRLPAAALDQQVNEEWSFAQTLRHLVLATDMWLGRAILDIEHPFHPIGLTDAGTQEDGFDMSILATVTPSYVEVLEVRAGRIAMVRDFLATATSDLLAAPRKNPHDPAHQETTRSCLHVILHEEWEHLRFAVRDLDAIEAKRDAEAGQPG